MSGLPGSADPRRLPADGPYVPISCSVHDRLEAAATLRRPITLEFEDGQGSAVVRAGVIADVAVRDGAEYLRLASGEEVRLDRLVAIDGESVRNAER